MAVPEATSIAFTRALDGLNMSDGVGRPLGYQPYTCCELRPIPEMRTAGGVKGFSIFWHNTILGGGSLCTFGMLK